MHLDVSQAGTVSPCDPACPSYELLSGDYVVAAPAVAAVS